MNQTPNYQLSQWEATDKVQRVDFNEDNAKIDAALKAQADTLSAHTAQIARLGNCQIWSSSYVGTGTAGQANPTRFTFPQKPLIAMIIGGDGIPSWLVPGISQFHTRNDICYQTWSGSTVSWYANVDEFNASKQMNAQGVVYKVFALLAK